MDQVKEKIEEDTVILVRNIQYLFLDFEGTEQDKNVFWTYWQSQSQKQRDIASKIIKKYISILDQYIDK